MIRTIAIVTALAFVTPAFAQGAAQPAAGGMAASSTAASKDSKMAAKPMAKAKAKAKTTDAMAAKDAKPAAAK